MSASAPAPSPPAAPRRGWWLPALLVPVALLPDLAAGLPLRTYYFRDFSVTFYPLRLFAARELREGRLPVWNPFIYEGTFSLPSLYPPDLLHVLAPGPAFVSWLLTLHLPVAALAACWLARELGASRAGALVSGAVYALGGFALSCLNLYVFLQALALAPLVAGLLRRAAERGGRPIVLAAGVLALSLSTLAVEFVAQAALLGVSLALASHASWRATARLSLAVILGVGLAGLPLAVTLGLLPETVRGAGFAGEVALGNAVHPAVLAQALLPNVFGALSAPAESWWGSRFFSKGMPYFLSLYLGPLVIALAGVGIRGIPERSRIALLGLAAVGLWYALGESWGLARLLAHVPFASSFRFPSKALLLTHTAVALAAGFGLDRLRRESGAWRGLTLVAAGLALAAAGVAGAVAAERPGFVAWTGVLPSYWPRLVPIVAREAAVVVGIAGIAAWLARGVARGRPRPAPAAVLLGVLAVVDLARGGMGLNPQTASSFFEPLPEMARLGLAQPGGARVFSYGSDHSPSFSRFLGAGTAQMGLAAFYANRQILGPYNNIVDRVEAPEATDLTSFVPRMRELDPAHYEPSRAGALLPWLHNAAVGHVLSFDPLAHPDFEEEAVVPVGPPGLAVRAYRLRSAFPRALVACRVTVVGAAEALGAPYTAGFDPARDVALEVDAHAECREARARLTAFAPAKVAYEIEADGAGLLLVRDSFARGWRARVDGRPTAVLRANGKHRAVAVPRGRHQVVMWYEPPGLRAGLGATGLAAIAAVALLVRGRRRRA